MNSQNSRWWSSENPRQFIETSLHPQKVDVWVSMSGERIFLCFFESSVKSDTKLSLLTLCQFWHFCRQICCNFYRQWKATYAWFQQDNATGHTSHQTTRHLLQIFGNRTIAKDLFPLHSPDLTPADSYWWGYLKDTVYANNQRTLNKLKNVITYITASTASACKLWGTSHLTLWNVLFYVYFCSTKSSLGL